MNRRLCITVLAMLVMAGSAAMAAEDQDHTFTLGSGKTVTLISMDPIHFSQGIALALQYRTKIPLSDMASLRKEVNEIWDRFTADAQNGGYRQAIISANEPAEGGVVSRNSVYNFVFTKQGNSWRMDETKGHEPIKLDDNYVKEYMDRLDWLYQNNEMSAFLLYLADNWTFSYTEGKNPPQSVDRMKFTLGTYQAMMATKEFNHQRKILKTTILKNGLAAEVESEETEQGIYNGQFKKQIEHTVDDIEVQGDSVVMVRSVAVIKDGSP